MISVLCPVCRSPLTREAGCWRCPAGHSFDVARQGYVNLLPVSQKHSRAPGDTRSQVAARKEFLDGGFYLPIAEKLLSLLGPAAPQTLLDVGCGEGYYLSFVQDALPGLEAAGVDISKDAVRYAAVRNKRALFLTATASHLPFPDGSFDALTSLFALTLPEEFSRVLRPGGLFLQATAGEEHLLGLKSIIYPEIRKKETHPDPALPGFALVREEVLEFSFTLRTGEDVMRLLSMTPHVMRITAEGLSRAQATERLTDRAQVRFRVYRSAQI